MLVLRFLLSKDYGMDPIIIKDYRDFGVKTNFPASTECRLGLHFFW
jgi:hypothetical protein